MSAEPIGRLIRELARLPGIGERTAARLAYHIIRTSHRDPARSLATDLAEALTDVQAQVGLCERCHNLCTGAMCAICQDGRREAQLVCVLESVADLRAMEQAGGYRGLYHVLHGALSPLDGIGPEALRIDQLLARLQHDQVREVILATNANVEGDATALYLAGCIAPQGIAVTRLASGIPQGGELEYLDGATLARAVRERRAFGSPG